MVKLSCAHAHCQSRKSESRVSPVCDHHRPPRASAHSAQRRVDRPHRQQRRRQQRPWRARPDRRRGLTRGAHQQLGCGGGGGAAAAAAPTPSGVEAAPHQPHVDVGSQKFAPPHPLANRLGGRFQLLAGGVREAAASATHRTPHRPSVSRLPRPARLGNKARTVCGGGGGGGGASGTHQTLSKGPRHSRVAAATRAQEACTAGESSERSPSTCTRTWCLYSCPCFETASSNLDMARVI
eukprot:COSAG01_NODE_6653_length_3562_cov_2.222062_8_plen_237_part_01